jgi:hypothetical protein
MEGLADQATTEVSTATMASTTINSIKVNPAAGLLQLGRQSRFLARFMARWAAYCQLPMSALRPSPPL